MNKGDMDNTPIVIAVAGAGDPPPGLPPQWPGCDIRFISSGAQLARDAADAEVVFLWDRVDWLRESCGPRGSLRSRLRWIATAFAGVDWLLFPELTSSDVIVTNAAGVFDAAMAEYTLALVSAICADLHTTIRLQARRQWQHRETTRLAGRRALVLGAGGIGRAIHRALSHSGIAVTCLGRHSRDDSGVGRIASLGDLPELLPGTDFVILALPLTTETKGIVGAAELALLSPGAWVINVGRGALMDEDALLGALRRGEVGGAALDVFTDEPLPETSPLWDLPNVIVSPHMSGDFRGWDRALTGLFLDQLRRYQAGAPLLNVVDKRLGFIPGS
jgi:phosphoglycerate dehydrogenase-like enzyme